MPVLSSPELGVMRARDVLAGLDGGAREFAGANGRQARA